MDSRYLTSLENRRPVSKRLDYVYTLIALHILKGSRILSGTLTVCMHFTRALYRAESPLFQLKLACNLSAIRKQTNPDRREQAKT